MNGVRRGNNGHNICPTWFTWSIQHSVFWLLLGINKELEECYVWLKKRWCDQMLMVISGSSTTFSKFKVICKFDGAFILYCNLFIKIQNFLDLKQGQRWSISLTLELVLTSRLLKRRQNLPNLPEEDNMWVEIRLFINLDSPHFVLFLLNILSFS